MYRPIRDYAIIGNLRSAVLISKDGSIDWAPAPYIDSPSIFASLLDDEKGGYWSIQPEGRFNCRQRYIKNTNVLVTTFTTATGVLEVTDYIPIEAEKTFMPAEEETTFKLKRRVRCISGTCTYRVEFAPRFDYARGCTELSYISRGILAQNGSMRGILVTHHKFSLDEEQNRAVLTDRLNEGEYEWFVFRYNTGTVDIKKDDKIHHNDELRRTVDEWRAWVERCDLIDCRRPERWLDHIVRSALLLKILFFEPIGTVAAAPTTSLPEQQGGVRNWDYRFTWLRDSSFTFQALFRTGHVTEAEQYLTWLVEQCERTSPDKLQIMYGLRGETELAEEILPHLKGYKGAKPVRIGNGAYCQDQWDIYGSVLDMAWQLHELKGDENFAAKHWNVLRGIADHVCEIWRRPDEGLWEVRGGANHFTYSKVMCWVALDRAIKFAQTFGHKGDIDRWENEREAIRHEVMSRGYNEDIGSFVQSFDSKDLDAAVLVFPAVGFIEGTDPRMNSTIEAVEKALSRGKGLLMRYTAEDGLPEGEGVFLLSSFWLIDALVLSGQVEKALRYFKRMLLLRNHVGLFSEEMEPESRDFLGNFPQAYTHIGLINSAYLLSKHISSQEMLQVDQAAVEAQASQV